MKLQARLLLLLLVVIGCIKSWQTINSSCKAGLFELRRRKLTGSFILLRNDADKQADKQADLNAMSGQLATTTTTIATMATILRPFQNDATRKRRILTEINQSEHSFDVACTRKSFWLLCKKKSLCAHGF